jgi:hypothetical protein
VALYSQREKDNIAQADKVTTEVWAKIAENQKAKVKLELNNYVGTYKDNWFGNITITEKKGKMYFNSERSPQLAGELFYYKDNIFAVKWFNRSFNADALLTFSANHANIKMAAISELTDFSYDFQDLDFNKKE